MVPVIEPRVVGPGFNARVYAVVRQVPAGFVTTYGHVAARLGSPRVARHVGFALAALTPEHEPVPWHRVINSQGRVSHHRASDQQRMLEDEGVVFDARGRVDLKRYLHTFAAREQTKPPAKKRAKAPVKKPSKASRR
ncbi:MGMT family protein [Paraliomyxa miuraensis]|uniref:MGMT family protein n=1 Tax=Paraliomyxa miuraensis TaxID=376150 RepID=UPI002259B9E8|nr:MGMT family protein [Paraliomyxa miuraensis]MCX4246824.1 MGMT family protein [Paraliomyxa miuraensis]